MWKLSYRGLESHLFWIPNLCRKFSGKHGNELRLVSGLGFRMPTIWKGMKKEKINEYEKLIVILLNFQMIRGLMVLNYLLIFKVYIVFSKCVTPYWGFLTLEEVPTYGTVSQHKVWKLTKMPHSLLFFISVYLNHAVLVKNVVKWDFFVVLLTTVSKVL